jgi:hypothetical protein
VVRTLPKRTRKQGSEIYVSGQPVQGNPMTVSESGEEFIFSQRIIKQLHFLDMKKFGNMKIYNRLVWGILYAQTSVYGLCFAGKHAGQPVCKQPGANEGRICFQKLPATGQCAYILL